MLRRVFVLLCALPLLAMHAPLDAPWEPATIALVPVTRYDSPLTGVASADLGDAVVAPRFAEARFESYVRCTSPRTAIRSNASGAPAGSPSCHRVP
jgi:hypothetical protein